MRKSSRPVNCAASLMPASVGELNAISLNERKLPKMKCPRIVVIIFDAMPKRRQFGATQIRDMPHLQFKKIGIYSYSIRFGWLCKLFACTLLDTWQLNSNPSRPCECNDVPVVVVVQRRHQRFDYVQCQDKLMTLAPIR